MNTYLGCFWENYSYEISRNLSSNLSIINTSSVTLFFGQGRCCHSLSLFQIKVNFFYIGEYKSLYLFTLQIVFLKPTDFRIHFQSIYFFLLLMSIQQPPFLYLPACTSASGGSLEGVTACNLFNSLCIPINRLELLPWRKKKQILANEFNAK